MNPPKTIFIRRGVLFEWLKSEGFSERQIRKLIKDGTIDRRKWRGEEKTKFLYLTNSATRAIEALKQPHGNR